MKNIPIKVSTPLNDTFLNGMPLYSAHSNNVGKESRFVGLDNHAYTSSASSCFIDADFFPCHYEKYYCTTVKSKYLFF